MRTRGRLARRVYQLSEWAWDRGSRRQHWDRYRRRRIAHFSRQVRP